MKLLRMKQQMQRGLSLVEMLVYMSVLMVVAGVGYSALHHSLNTASALGHSSSDIVNALHLGEDWRMDIRAAEGTISVETLADEEILHLDGRRGPVSYRFAGQTVFRRLGTNEWSSLLTNVKASRFVEDRRPAVTAWRWELEMQPHAKRLSQIRPRFTFIAVPTGDLLK